MNVATLEAILENLPPEMEVFMEFDSEVININGASIKPVIILNSDDSEKQAIVEDHLVLECEEEEFKPQDDERI